MAFDGGPHPRCFCRYNLVRGGWQARSSSKKLVVGESNLLLLQEGSRFKNRATIRKVGLD
jgi:hypothetical protein